MLLCAMSFTSIKFLEMQTNRIGEIKQQNSLLARPSVFPLLFSKKVREYVGKCSF